MPAIEINDLHQKAVLWAATGYDDYGEPTIGSATGTEIDVRWIDEQSEVSDPKGGTIASIATVIVDQDIAVGSVMWLGELANYVASAVKMQVVDAQKIPDVKGRVFRRVLRLTKLSKELPLVV